MKSIMNIITQLLAYSDNSGTTDNPQKRDYDWSRRFHSLSIDNPAHDKVFLAPGESAILFDGVRSTSLDGTSVMSIELIRDSVYSLKVTAGLSGFRAARSITGLGGCTVTVNNNAVASFKFTGATISAFVGDTMRISGFCGYDTAPYSFSSLNAGKWRIISIVGDTIQATRLTGVPFSGLTETVPVVGAGQVEIYSSSGVQQYDKFEISNGFSVATQRTYEVMDARPSEILFTSTSPIPEESGIAFVSGAVVFYSNAKKIIYLETDQEISIKFNNDSSELNRVSPIMVGDPDLVGYFHKYGISYKAVVTNKSINTAMVRYFTAE